MGPSGLIAILAGWFTTEIGRQPWVVYGLMRTADASSNHSFLQMSITLVLFVVVYFALFGAGLGLDSIDALELSLAISKKYGFQLRSDNDDNRRIFGSLRALSAHVEQHRAS